MSLREEMWRYGKLTGESAEHIPIIQLGAYLDGVDKGIEELEKIKTEIIKYHQIDCNLNCDNCKYIGCIEAEDAVADIKIIDKHISEIKGD